MESNRTGSKLSLMSVTTTNPSKLTFHPSIDFVFFPRICAKIWREIMRVNHDYSTDRDEL
ncbi:hypothetical protein HJC23_010786 [Cyclotella cryptica]|uniref:Uncharacterized protein n=1 Tax=Cyclotella cryptica TaxID=29204 RepID=A0ABD3NC87_9STRA